MIPVPFNQAKESRCAGNNSAFSRLLLGLSCNESVCTKASIFPSSPHDVDKDLLVLWKDTVLYQAMQPCPRCCWYID